MAETDITSGDIAAGVKDTAPAVASPAQQTQKPETPAPAAIAPAESPEPKTDAFGPMPFERHHAILDNTRRMYEDRLAHLAWAERVDQERAERALQIAEMYDRRDPRLMEHLKGGASERPEPDAKDERGEPFYSPQQASKLAKWEAAEIKRELKQEMDERFGPMAETFTRSQERQDALVNELTEAKTWPDFDKHTEATTKHLNDARLKGAPITLHEAYTRARVAAEIATLEPTTRRKILAELNNTTEVTKHELNPGRSPSGSRKKDSEMSMSELIADELAKAKAS